MERKTKRLLDALLDYVDADEGDVVKNGLSVGIMTDDVLGAPFIKELNIKLKYVDRNELKRYDDERGTTKEG